MDVQRYISSGILESYVFGMLPETEQGEVETAVLQYPDVKAAVSSLQLDKERFVQLYAIAPPAGIKERLMEAIRLENTPEGNNLLPDELRAPAAAPANGKYHRREKAPKETPVKQLPVTKTSSNDRLWKYLTAAIVVLLIGSVVMNFFFFQKSTDYKSRYKSLIATKEKLEADKAQQSQASLKKTDSSALAEVDPLSNPDFKWTKITGGGAYAGNEVSVGWNARTQGVYLQATLMPVPPAGKQYQLWAIVNKKLVDAGVFETGAAVSQQLQQMKAMTVAQGFAITLEKKGGSPDPSMDQVCMSAKIAR
ncbi:anti-sigma factor [Chitinophaga arvensicola]|uniref:Anti-sigma-K factor rskA n=1 Tax=Chitinophaga arvensicola TaxID=29529 RepID=A0A1I0SCF9_9BACT|nr:anti-sigma factor [Chitinophaga arvensicola]SEW54771.1 Anti-sigma-K factor rskA [Chitinophaga arvensicola]